MDETSRSILPRARHKQVRQTPLSYLASGELSAVKCFAALFVFLINADKRYFELTFNNDNRQSQNQNQNEAEGVRIPKTLLGVTLSEKQQADIKAGQTIYVSGMKDKEGQDFNAYVKINAEKGKLEFFKWNPDKAKKQGAEVTPDNTHKTQVAKNNDGKTTEATKNVSEPLKSGQNQPDEKQKKEEQKKNRGIKM
ncbi:MAG: DUF3945 domain-containing protein [Prevotellaceae bacterium]|jgi:hypothetical protein|nr:DUF3945 domain-containing protein [Prevotellaceae bacterium]